MTNPTLLAIALLAAACGSTTGTPSIDAKVVTIESLSITPMTKMVKRAVDAPTKLTATAMRSDGTMLDVSASVTWASSDPTVATVDAGLVSYVGLGTANITATLGTQSAMATFTVTNPLVYIANASPPIGIAVFDAYTSGNTAPLRQITGAATTLTFPWGVVVTDTEIYTADQSAIDVFAIDATGNIAPTRRIVGPTTTLATAEGLAIFNNEIYVGCANKVLVFPQNATGDLAPTRTITGPLTGLGSFLVSLTVDNNELYVVSQSGPASIGVFPVNASGNVAPSRLIAGTHPQYGPYPMAVETFNDELLVATGAGIRVFPETATGDASPIRSIEGPNVLVQLSGMARLGSELLEPNLSGTVGVVDLEATGDIIPKRTLAGATTTLTSPRGVTVH
jgi:hypothetical protein